MHVKINDVYKLLLLLLLLFRVMNAKFLWEKPIGHELENKLPQNIASICQFGRNNIEKRIKENK